MLTLYKVVPDRLEYYLDITQDGTPGPFYERDGYWRSPGSQSADTSVCVLKEQLLGLGTGVDPRTRQIPNAFQRLVQTCALDMTFAAPKGVSMLFALGNDAAREAVEFAQRRSVIETMDFVDRRIISVSRRVAGVRNLRHARTIDQAVFEHRTSRANDPHLHSHVLVPNLASDDTLCWSAFDFRPLYVHVGLLGSLYRSGLRHHLSSALGVRWREIQPGWYDLAGLSPPMIRSFSRRRQEIFDEVGDRSRSSHRVTTIAASRSRSPRSLGVGYDELLADWRTRAHRVGISTSRLEEVTGYRRDHPLEHRAQIAQAIADIGTKGEGITLVELLRHLANTGRSGHSIADLEAGVERAVASRVIGVPRDLWPYGPRRTRVIERARALETSRVVGGPGREPLAMSGSGPSSPGRSRPLGHLLV